MDGVTQALKSAIKRDGLALMIQDHDGQQYVVETKFFVPNKGDSFATRGYLESVARAAKRFMRYVKPDISIQDYEVFRPKNLGPLKTYFVVWFPAAGAFHVNEEKWCGFLTPASSTNSFIRTKMRAIACVSKQASEMHVKRIKQNQKETPVPLLTEGV